MTREMRFVPGRAALQRTAYVAGALVVAYAVIGFFAVPYLIERYGPHLAAEALHGSVSVGEVEFNPFTLVLDARRVTIATPNGDSVLSVGNMHFNAQAASLLRWAWSFESVRFDEPDARIEIGRDGVLNLAALVPLPDGGPDATDDAEGPAPRVFVERFLLAGGGSCMPIDPGHPRSPRLSGRSTSKPRRSLLCATGPAGIGSPRRCSTAAICTGKAA